MENPRTVRKTLSYLSDLCLLMRAVSRSVHAVATVSGPDRSWLSTKIMRGWWSVSRPLGPRSR